MNILVSNCGSSSLKATLYGGEGDVLASGQVAGLAGPEPRMELTGAGEQLSHALDVANHSDAFAALSESLAKRAGGVAVDAVGHRVVHGGERFSRATRIDDEVERAIEELIPLAPLHNPLCLEGIRAARRAFPDAAHVAVFDTAFHQTLPEAAYLYALPYDAYERDGVRRYGFHGSSHRSVSARAIEWLGGIANGTRVITCHLGAGCSTAAIRDGRSIDTSMGMTPLEGLVMSTRSGDVDPGVFAYLAERRDLDAAGVEALLQSESGLLGLSGSTGDLKALLASAASGDAAAERAIAVFAHRVRRYIGAHLAVLGGADALVFTGGAGENSPVLRMRILEGLEGLGFRIDPERNEAHVGVEGVISTEGARTAVYVIAADEERAIAEETRALLARASG